MKLSFKHLTAACAALLLGAATLNAQTGTTGTSSAGAPATDQQSPDRTPTTPTSPAASGPATTATPDNNVPGSAATDTSTNAAPSTSAATTTNTSTTTTSTQRSAMAPRTIYLGTGYKGTPASLTIKHGYKVYDENGKLVGHLTDLSGSTIKSLPASGDFEIKTRAGKLIGSTQSGDGVDSSRAVQLTR